MAITLVALALWGCGGEPRPEELAKGRDLCGACRMPVSDARFAAQIAASGELPRFFDDIGCLSSYLKSGSPPVDPRTVFVTDHRTGLWIRADQAVFTRVPGLSTPMSHHLIAHANPASRDSDPDARGGEPLNARDVLGPVAVAGKGVS